MSDAALLNRGPVSAARGIALLAAAAVRNEDLVRRAVARR
jgi:hypothetical protein